MKAHKLCGLCCSVALVVGVFAISASGPQVYTEDFTTKIYKDEGYTNALWDTVAGELKLLPFELLLVGGYDTPGFARRVAVSGDYAYVADATSGLQVLDISVPWSPGLAGSYDTPGSAQNVAVSGDYAYVADHGSGLQVIDISDPTTPSLAGGYDTSGNARSVSISGDYAYVADESFGIQVFDISDPTIPSLAGSYTTPGWALDVIICGDYGYVADHSSGLTVIDVSDPTNPSSIGSYDTPGNSWAVTISGDYAYVADEGSGLQVIDISDPTNPSLAGSYDTPGTAYGVTVTGDYAYVADWGSGLHVMDISDPTSPTLIESYVTPGTAFSAAIAGNFAYVADYGLGLQVIYVCESKSPAIVGSYDTPGSANGVAIFGDYAFQTDGNSGVLVLDISDPVNPLYAGSYDTDYNAYDIDVSGDYAYVADGNGLKVLDISDPTSPSLTGSYNTTPGSAQSVFISGDYAYVTRYLDGLYVIDISDPTSPTLAGGYDTPGYAVDVVVSGDYAYVADDQEGFQVIDITDPTNPAQAGSYITTGHPRGVVISGDYAYLAARYYGLQVIDISDPTNPAQAGSYAIPDGPWDVAVSGDYAYLAADTSGLWVIDISDPANPSFAGSCKTNFARKVTISGDYAYVAGNYGLDVIWVFQRFLNTVNNRGRSIQINSSPHEIGFVKLSSTQIDTVLWKVCANGTDWQEILPDNSWSIIANPGSDLRWRSTHEYSVPFANPACSNLVIDWLSFFPVIETITDISNDQGRQVSISWTRSGYDYLGSSTPITEYAIYRKIDLDLSAPSDTKLPGKGFEDKPAIVSGPHPPLAYPPGDWHFLMTVPADCEDSYAAVVATLADSTIAEGMYYTTFFVSALTATPGVYFDSPPDSGYSVDNLAPGAPSGFAVAYSTGSGNELTWEECAAEDFVCFRIYRNETEDFNPTPSDLVQTTAGTEWLDTVEGGWKYNYKITAVDGSDNESPPASPGTTTGAEVFKLPETYKLYQNIPNPFNPTTTIRFDLPERSHVKITVYNTRGQLIRVLLDRYVDKGSRKVTWDGRDSTGRGVASGIYFYRLETTTFCESRKMILIK